MVRVEKRNMVRIRKGQVEDECKCCVDQVLDEGEYKQHEGERWMVGPLLGLNFAYVMKFQQLTDEIRNETQIGPMGTGRKRSPSTNQSA